TGQFSGEWRQLPLKYHLCSNRPTGISSTSAPGTPRHGLSLGVKPRRRHETFSDGLPATKRERARIRTEGAGIRRGYGPLGPGWSHTLALSSKQFLLHRETGRDLPWLRRQKLHYFGGF